MTDEPKKQIIAYEHPQYPKEPWIITLEMPFSEFSELLDNAIKSTSFYYAELTETIEQRTYDIKNTSSRHIVTITIRPIEQNTFFSVSDIVHYVGSYETIMNMLFIWFRVNTNRPGLIGDAPDAVHKALPPKPARQELNWAAEKEQLNTSQDDWIVHNKEQMAKLNDPQTKIQVPVPKNSIDLNPSVRSKPTAKEALAIFKKRKRTEKLLTLKQVCEELGLNYGSVRVAKSRNTKRKNPKGK